MAKPIARWSSHGVDAGPRLLRVRMPVDQLQGLICLPIHDQSLCHALGRYRTGLQLTNASVSSTRFQTRLTSRWGECAIRCFNKMEQDMAFSAMFADFMWSKTFHAPSIFFARTRACKCSLNVAQLARIPLCQLLGVIEVICIEVPLEESVVIPGVQLNDRQPQSIIRVSTMNQCLDEAIVQQRVDGTIFHLEFSRKQQR